MASLDSSEDLRLGCAGTNAAAFQKFALIRKGFLVGGSGIGSMLGVSCQLQTFCVASEDSRTPILDTGKSEGTMEETSRNSLSELALELENFEEIARYLVPSPGDMPDLDGIDVYGKSLPLNGLVGGDHIIYLDFKKRYDLVARIKKAKMSGLESVVQNLVGCQRKAGIVLADVSGHRITDALLALMLHQAFLLGARYELSHYGEITTRLFEHLNTRFYNSSSVAKYLTLIYGEIHEEGKFSFVSAAHPSPVVFSAKYNQLVDICPETLLTFPPIGTMPSYEDIDRRTYQPVLGFKEKYEVNEINLMGSGDILILLSDGLSEHSRGEAAFFPLQLQSVLRDTKEGSAREIFEAIHRNLLEFSDPHDDISYVVVKRH